MFSNEVEFLQVWLEVSKYLQNVVFYYRTIKIYETFQYKIRIDFRMNWWVAPHLNELIWFLAEYWTRKKHHLLLQEVLVHEGIVYDIYSHTRRHIPWTGSTKLVWERNLARLIILEWGMEGAHWGVGCGTLMRTVRSNLPPGAEDCQ